MTNKNITLTIPNDDAIALHEFGAAMQRMANRHGLEVPQTVVERVTDTCGDLSHTVERVLVDTDKAQLAALGESLSPFTATGEALCNVVKLNGSPVTVTDDTIQFNADCEVTVSKTFNVSTDSRLDSDGLPWDARIHASSKERNSDDTWRARRKPADMDAGQWAEFQGQVRTELRALMAVPVEQEVAMVLGEEPTPIVVEPIEPEPIVVTPPPVVEPVAPVVEPVAPVVEPVAPVVEPVAPVVEPVAPPPVVVTPPPVAAGPTEFVPFLQWVTGNGYTPAQVNAALAKHGLTAVPQLQQRPDLIPQVHASIVAGV